MDTHKNFISLPVGMLLLCLGTLLSCKDYTIAPVLINPGFEMNPPLPTGVWIERLRKPTDAGNFLLTAQYDKGAVMSDYLAMMISDSIKLVWHDDGENNDAKAGDGIYSVVIQQDEQALTRELEDFSARLKAQKRLITFENRAVVEMDRDRVLKEFPFINKIDLGARLPIDILELALPTPAEVASIRSHSLFITDGSVVGDFVRAPSPCNPDLSFTSTGVWSLGALMTELANEPVTGMKPVDFVMNWLSLWQHDAVVNGDTAKARGIAGVIRAWHFFSGPGQPLRIDRLPFQLRAIVNRLDLRGNSGYGFSNAGEARFIFTLVDNDCNGAPFNIILEYGVNKRTCAEITAYAQQWLDLQTETVGSEAYNAKLQAITDQFTKAGTNPDGPAGSSLNQLRTNEIAIGSPWEMREFVMADSTRTLEMHTVAQTPSDVHNAKNDFTEPFPTLSDVERMVGYINAHAATISANRYTVPDSVGGIPFLGAKSRVSSDFTYHWNGSTNPMDVSRYIINDQARHIFSLNTCSGCHRGEVTVNFTHVNHSFTVLSSFLTGLGSDDRSTDDDTDPTGFFYVNDVAGRPTAGPTQRGFNDLDRRARDLFTLRDGCRARISLRDVVRVIRFNPVRMSH